MRATVDAYGTVYLDIAGSQAPDKIIATGSHMDTVVHGGPYDGLYGVLGGFQAICELIQVAWSTQKNVAANLI